MLFSALRVTVVLDLLCCFSVLVLCVTLYAITREQDSALAMLAMVCRAGEGFLGATGIPKTLGLLWLASTPSAGPEREPGFSDSLPFTKPARKERMLY